MQTQNKMQGLDLAILKGTLTQGECKFAVALFGQKRVAMEIIDKKREELKLKKRILQSQIDRLSELERAIEKNPSLLD